MFSFIHIFQKPKIEREITLADLKPKGRFLHNRPMKRGMRTVWKKYD